jgi:lysine 6-dehydrogenase
MSNIIVLGAGMVGSAMAIDLASKHKVTLTDLNIERMRRTKEKCKSLNILELDVKNKEKLKSTVKSFDLVISAVPGFLGLWCSPGHA